MRVRPLANAVRQFDVTQGRSEMRMTTGWGRVVRVGRWALAATGFVAIAASGVAMAARTKGVSQRTTIPGQSLGSATAKCTRGSTAVAAGFQAPGFDPNNSNSTVARVSSSLIGNRRVKTRAFNFGTQDGDLVSFAYCRRAADPPRVRSDRVSLLGGTTGSAVARCPDGTEAVGGGFQGDFSMTGGQAVIALTSKRLGDSRWMVEGFNAGGAPADLIGYAYCKHTRHRLVTRSKRTTAPTDHLKTFAVGCPRGGRAVAGGFDGHLDSSGPVTGAGAVTSRRTHHRTAWRTSAVGAFGQPGTITGYAYCRTS
jgi:hypothetical protein